ncbi:TPA: hypothetical protein U8251_002205 [Pseudomonas putida]|nr:hypothetical protein [Pseudomonas putida]
MYLGYPVPSWSEIESRIADETGYQGHAHYRTQLNEPAASLALNLRRVRAVQSAFNQAEWQASNILRRRFAELEIASILNELLQAVREMAMIVVGSTLSGAAIGAGIGVFGAGAGAIPLAGTGAMIGLKVSGWILGVLGLSSIAEFFIEGLPRTGKYYLDGIRIAWEGTRDESQNPFGRDDPHAVSRAAHHIALGHVDVVVLLLGAMVSYLTRGHGDARVLAQEMAASRKGARLGQWMLKHEEGLKQRPDLQVPERRKGAVIESQSIPPQRPTGKDKEPSPGKPGSMPLHTVSCFKADKLPASKHGEFERQLKGQQDGLNRPTVEEFLENVNNPIKRDPKFAKKARRDLYTNLRDRIHQDLSRTMGPREARKLSETQAKETMSTLAALHNPDLSAGGRDTIADFGDKKVNSSIGPQWKSRIGGLRQVAEEMAGSGGGSGHLNVKLHKC